MIYEHVNSLTLYVPLCFKYCWSVVGVCIAGDFSGPHNNAVCPEAINAAHHIVGEASWSFRSCPDLKECQLGRHDCVKNAECIETHESYECHCKKG